jgi:hypothetical protein
MSFAATHIVRLSFSGLAALLAAAPFGGLALLAGCGNPEPGSSCDVEGEEVPCPDGQIQACASCSSKGPPYVADAAPHCWSKCFTPCKNNGVSCKKDVECCAAKCSPEGVCVFPW